LASSATISSVEKIARSDPKHASTAEEWDADIWALNTPGGVVDLRTGRMRPHRRDDRMTKVSTATPQGDSPMWSAFLADVTGGDAELMAYLQLMVGYCLTGVTSEHALFFLYGTGAHRPAPDRSGRPARRALCVIHRNRTGSALERIQGQGHHRWRQGVRALHAPGLLRVPAAVQVGDRGQPQALNPKRGRGDEAATAPDPVHGDDPARAA
jgi:hypothetical protein